MRGERNISNKADILNEQHKMMFIKYYNIIVVQLL